MSRMLSDKFHRDLEAGDLSGLTERIRKDDTLMLALRGHSINVYYRGGNILRLTQQGGGYAAKFDSNYSKDKETPIPALPTVIETEAHCKLWLDALPTLKEIMNRYFAGKRKSEREFQQLVAWENNRSAISNETEYFITDIEFADVEQNARIDMLGLKWLSHNRKDGSNCRPVLIEMKYGIGAYDGEAGIAKHIKDMEAILGDPAKKKHLSKTIADQFNQLCSLDLVLFNKSKAYKGVTVSETPEVVFLLANHNPRSKTLLNILEALPEPTSFDLRFFNASFAGYGMHDACMIGLDDFKKHLRLFAS